MIRIRFISYYEFPNKYTVFKYFIQSDIMCVVKCRRHGVNGSGALILEITNCVLQASEPTVAQLKYMLVSSTGIEKFHSHGVCLWFSH